MSHGMYGWNMPEFPAGSAKIRSWRVGADVPPTSQMILGDVPTTFRHLLLRFIGRTDAAAVNARVVAQVNADSTNADYDAQQLFGSNGTPAAGIQTNNPGLMLGDVPGTSVAATGRPAIIEAKIYDYAETFWNKVCLSHTGYTSATVAQVVTSQYLSTWHSTNQITNLVLVLASGNFVVGSVVDLYGEY